MTNSIMNGQQEFRYIQKIYYYLLSAGYWREPQYFWSHIKDSISRKILREKSLARRSLVYIFSTNRCPFLKITVCHVLRTWSPWRDQWTIESYKSLLSSNFLNWSVNTHNEWCWKFLSTHRIEERIDMNS